MSDLDNEDSQCRGRLDLESNTPHYFTLDLIRHKKYSIHLKTNKFLVMNAKVNFTLFVIYFKTNFKR